MEELNPDVLVITKHGLNSSNVEFFKIQNYQFADYYCRNSIKGGGVAMFPNNNISFTFIFKEPVYMDFKTTSVKVQTNKNGNALD